MQFVADLHTHTVASGHAYSTVLEVARAAADKGLALVAITDHGPKMPGGPHPYHFGNLKAIPPVVYGVRVLCGVEANVIDRQGTLDLDEERLGKLDIVLVGLHTYCAPYGSVEENTAMLINAMRHPLVDIVVHPGNPEYHIDPLRVVRAAVDYDVALEVNNSSLTISRPGSCDTCREIVRLARQYGAKLALGSDSHIALTVGELGAAATLLAEAGVPPEQVLNTSLERIQAHLGRHRTAAAACFQYG